MQERERVRDRMRRQTAAEARKEEVRKIGFLIQRIQRQTIGLVNTEVSWPVVADLARLREQLEAAVVPWYYQANGLDEERAMEALRREYPGDGR